MAIDPYPEKRFRIKPLLIVSPSGYINYSWLICAANKSDAAGGINDG